MQAARRLRRTGRRPGSVRAVNEVNWAGNVVYGARRLHHPTSVEQLREIVTAASRIRVLGSRHSFNKIADSCELVSLNRPNLSYSPKKGAHSSVSISCAATSD